MTRSAFLQTLCAPALTAQLRNPAYAPVTDVPGLPRVLLLGDSISIGYTPAARRLLDGKANVRRPADNCRTTAYGLEQMDKWLGSGQWDVIHFNFGLHDLIVREGPGQQVPLPQYEVNLRKLVARLQSTGAKLIWASTTPVPSGTGSRPQGEELRYNAAASKIMRELRVPVNDLHDFALSRLARIQQPANVHFTAEGSEALAGEVAGAIRAALGSRGATH
jgi:acyl-CoA thioesterase-1